MAGAQQALLQLVASEDRVAEYWMELAKIQAATGSMGDAYHSLTRAYELDRSNVGLLQALTEFALRGGDPAMAQVYARQLEVVSPGDPWVKLTKGYGALREGRFDEAVSTSNQVLDLSPFDSQAKVLKARAMLGKQQETDAVALLTEQVRVQPSDWNSLLLLANIYEHRGDWRRVSSIARQLAQLQPADKKYALLAIRAAFKAGQSAQGRRDSWQLLTSGPEPAAVSSVLDIWLDSWPSPQRVEDSVVLGRRAPSLGQKLQYAVFLNRVGSPSSAVKLLAGAAKYPISADNADAIAVVADALGRNGKFTAARKQFGDVLAFDPGNMLALRGHAELLLRMGKAKEAIPDAEKLVTLSPASPRDRLLLARVYLAAGDAQQAQRTLWDAFREIPADDQIYAALTQLSSSPDGRIALQREFARQSAGKINQGLL